MERRNFGLGAGIGCLGLAVLGCLLPYLVSSLYSIVSSLLRAPTAPTWLWGEWVNRVAGRNDFLYMVLAEGPICGVGVLALLLIVVGVMLVLGRSDGRPMDDAEQAYTVEQPYLEEGD